jgi:hypothetical protein
VKKYKLYNDLTIFANNDSEFCKRLFWRSVFAPEKTLPDYLVGFATRAEKMFKLPFRIRTKPHEDFVADLVSCKLLTVNQIH